MVKTTGRSLVSKNGTRMTRILTLTGPPGSGKSTIASRLLEIGGFSLITSYTTRAQRPTDLPGEYYYFSPQDFANFAERNKFLWEATVRDLRYGTTKESIKLALQNRDKVSIMILVPEILKTLRDFVGKVGEAEDLLHLLIQTDQEVVLSRFKDQNKDDVLKRINDGRKWTQEMADAGVPCRVVQNNGDIEETIQEVIRTLIRRKI